jgi:hypothetical protein
MITWQQVVPAASILGDPVGHSRTVTGGFDALDRFFVGTQFLIADWFEGSFQETYIGVDDEFYDDFEEISTVGNSDRYTGSYQTNYESATIINGSGTTHIPVTVLVGVEDGFEEFLGPDTFTTSNFDSNWSRISETLQSWKGTTLFNQTGRVTTESVTNEFRRTTSAQGEETVTTNSLFAITRTSTSQISTSTVATWEPESYQTVYITGETTAKHYSSFSNQLPAVLDDGTLKTTQSTIEPLSFVEYEGFSNTQNGVEATIGSFTQLNLPSVTQTAGGSVVNSTNPQISLVGAVALTSSERAFGLDTTVTTVYNDIFTTKSYALRIKSSSQMQFVGQNIAATYYKTESLGEFALGFLESFEAPEAVTQDGIFDILPTNHVATERAANLSVAQSVEVGVRANTNDALAGGIPLIARGQNFYRHTTSAFLPATATFLRSSSSFTFSLNSYTARDSDGSQTESTFEATGASSSQWMTANGIAQQSFANQATVVGGNVVGEAIVANGNYQTFSPIGEGATEITEPLKVTWTAGAATTAWLPNLRVETAAVAFPFGPAGPVIEISRHSFTQVIDD